MFSKEKIGRIEIVILAIAVTLMLIVPSLLYQNYMDINEDPDDNIPDLPVGDVQELMMIEPTFEITSDVEWSSETMFLDWPVRIHQGAALDIDGCQLMIRWEDLLLWNTTPFEVLEGGRLTIVDSDIVLVVDDRALQAAYFGLASRNQWSDARSTPVLSRVVNLDDAMNPMLSFDVSWRVLSTDIMVVGQRSIDEPLQLLTTLNGSYLGEGQWNRFVVPLRGLGTGVSRVAITPVNMSFGALMVSNVHLTEGVQRLPHDIATTGRASVDGWRLDGFRELNEDLYERIRWPGLIDAKGDVEIYGSFIMEPPEMPRWVRAEVNGREASLPEGVNESHNTLSATLGGHIGVADANLTIIDSHIMNVPLLFERTDVDISLSRIRGDADLVTLLDCSGSIRETDLISTNTTIWDPYRGSYAPNLPYRYDFDYKYFWGLSVEGTLGGLPLVLDHVLFNNSDVGMDLNNAHVKMEGCEFRGTWRLSIWNHNSSGLGNWSDVTTSTDFLDCHGYLYFETWDCTLEFIDEARPNGKDLDSGYGYGGLVDPTYSELPDVRIFWINGWEASPYLPLVCVDSMWNVSIYSSTTLRLYTNWGGEVILDVLAGQTDIDVVFPGKDPNGNQKGKSFEEGLPEVNTWPGFFPGDEVGWIRSEFYIRPWDFYRHGLTRNARLLLFNDDRECARIDLLEGTDEYDLSVTREATFELDPGLNNMTLIISAGRENETEDIQLLNWTIPLFRVIPSTPATLLEDQMSDWYPLFILDPEVDLEITCPKKNESIDRRIYYYIDIIAFEDSRMTMTGIEAGYMDLFYLTVTGSGVVEVDGVDCEECILTLTNTSVVVGNLTCDFFTSIARETTIPTSTSIIMHDSHLGDPGYNGWDGNVNATFWNCTFGPVEYCLYFPLTNGSLTMKDCHVYSEVSNQMYVWLSENNLVDIADTIFTNITLLVSTSSDIHVPVTDIRITGCQFWGEDAYLSIIEEGGRGDNTVDYELTGNIAENLFEGESCGIIADWQLFDTILGSNTLQKGAGLFSTYYIDITLVGDVERFPVRGSILPVDTIPTIAQYCLEHTGRSGNYWRSFYTIVEVTGVPGRVLSPGLVTFMFRAGSVGQDDIIWFGLVDPMSQIAPIEIPTWIDIPELVFDLKVELGLFNT